MSGFDAVPLQIVQTIESRDPPVRIDCNDQVKPISDRQLHVPQPSVEQPVVTSVPEGPIASGSRGIKRKERSDGDSIWECPICFGSLGMAGIVPCTLSGCGHMFCLECARKEQPTGRGCPKCRESFKRITPLTELVDANDQVAAESLEAFRRSTERLPLKDRIKLLPICDDPVIAKRLAFVANYIELRCRERANQPSFTVFWSDVPDFDLNHVTLLVKEARRVYGLRRPNRVNLKLTLHYQALVLEDSLNTLFNPEFRVEALEQTNRRGTVQVYMRFKVTRMIAAHNK